MRNIASPIAMDGDKYDMSATANHPREVTRFLPDLGIQTRASVLMSLYTSPQAQSPLNLARETQTQITSTGRMPQVVPLLFPQQLLLNRKHSHHSSPQIQTQTPAQVETTKSWFQEKVKPDKAYQTMDVKICCMGMWLMTERGLQEKE